MQAVIDAIDAGTGPGIAEILDDGYGKVLAVSSCPSRPSSREMGEIMLVGSPNELAIDSGRPAAARIKDGDGNIIISGLTVGADIYLDRTNIVAGQRVHLTFGSIAHG
jgi:hypothetical protein